MVLSLASCSSSDSGSSIPESSEIETTAESAVSSTANSDFDPEFTFKTTDRDGNEFDESIFASNKLTMINFWEPWCGPCCKELPDLTSLYENYKDQGFQILGVYSETHMESDVRDILSKKQVTYPILHYTSEFDQFQTGSSLLYRSTKPSPSHMSILILSDLPPQNRKILLVNGSRWY